jgi:hypothetical protein
MTGWRLALFAAALFNFAVGLPMVIAPNVVAGGLGMTDANALTVRLLGWMITTFGIGYAMAGVEPRKHRGIVLLGIIGKGGVIALTWWLAWRGLVARDTALLAGGDLVFVLIFIAFLRRTRA